MKTLTNNSIYTDIHIAYRSTTEDIKYIIPTLLADDKIYLTNSN